jgi:hypothetical protein
MFNLFFNNKKNNPQEEKIRYTSICGIVEGVEFNRTKKEINGVLFDLEGREFNFKSTLNGRLLYLTGEQEDLPLAWTICSDYLKNKYNKKEIHELRKEINSKMEQLMFAIEELSEEVSEIEIPEIAPQIESITVLEEPINTVHTQIDEESFEDEENDNQLTFQDFSDEDLASHALKVLNGEVKLNA